MKPPSSAASGLYLLLSGAPANRRPTLVGTPSTESLACERLRSPRFSSRAAAITARARRSASRIGGQAELILGEGVAAPDPGKRALPTIGDVRLPLEYRHNLTPTIIANAAFQIKIETARGLLRAVLGSERAWERRECLSSGEAWRSSRALGCEMIRAPSAGYIEAGRSPLFYIRRFARSDRARRSSLDLGPEQHLRFARRTGISQPCRRPAASVHPSARPEPSTGCLKSMMETSGLILRQWLVFSRRVASLGEPASARARAHAGSLFHRYPFLRQRKPFLRSFHHPNR